MKTSKSAQPTKVRTFAIGAIGICMYFASTTKTHTRYCTWYVPDNRTSYMSFVAVKPVIICRHHYLLRKNYAPRRRRDRTITPSLQIWVFKVFFRSYGFFVFFFVVPTTVDLFVRFRRFLCCSLLSESSHPRSEAPYYQYSIILLIIIHGNTVSRLCF